MAKRFAVYVDIESDDRVTRQQVLEAVNFGLLHLFKHDRDLPKFELNVHEVPTPEKWQAGHLNTQTAIGMRRGAQDD